MQKELGIFMATHSEKCEQIAEWIIPIQVGAVLKQDHFEEILDSTLENISNKNSTFCELTALYWMWKNTQYKNVGLYHYRRKFALEKEQILFMLIQSDIILPQEKRFRISIEEQYVREHSREDWDEMLQALKELYPAYYETSQKVFRGNKLYKYNMFIASNKIFKAYCDWLFPLLFQIEQVGADRYRDDYQKRYIGFLAERLFNVYIVHNRLRVTEAKILFSNKEVRTEWLINNINDILFKGKKLFNKAKGRK